MKPSKIIQWSVFSAVAVTLPLVPSVAFADALSQAPETGVVRDAAGAVEIHEAIVITVEGRRSESFLRQYIYALAHRVDLSALFEEVEETNRIAPGVLEPADFVMAPLDKEPWLRDHIGFAIAF